MENDETPAPETPAPETQPAPELEDQETWQDRMIKAINKNSEVTERVLARLSSESPPPSPPPQPANDPEPEAEVLKIEVPKQPPPPPSRRAGRTRTLRLTRRS
jgi:hypothetical protein